MTSQEAALKVLETWQGTPEELGEALHDATMVVIGDEKRIALRATARSRILQCEGGMELLMAEERLLRGENE